MCYLIFFLSVSSVYTWFLPNHNEYIYYNKIHKRSQYDNWNENFHGLMYLENLNSTNHIYLSHIFQESETSIIEDASKYIKKLKHKVEKINNETTSEQYFCDPTDPMVYKHIRTLWVFDALTLRSVSWFWSFVLMIGYSGNPREGIHDKGNVK